jgi:histone acetyltransferase (RNA polymerase elongator complex component)
MSGLSPDRKTGFITGQRKFDRKRRMALVGFRRDKTQVHPCLVIKGRRSNEIVNTWRRNHGAYSPTNGERRADWNGS